MPDKKEKQKSAAALSFINSVLGRLSSHPEMQKQQRVILFLLGLVPVLATAALIVYAYMHGIVSIGKWDNLVLSFKILFIASGVTVGFIVTAVAMNVAGRTMANSKFGPVNDKDAAVPPFAILAIIAFFWLVPWAYRYLPYWSQSKDVEFILNLLCLAPFGCMLLWMFFASSEEAEKKDEKVARRPIASSEEAEKEDEKVARRPIFLIISILLFAATVYLLLPIAKVTSEKMRAVLMLCMLTGGVVMLCVWLVNFKNVKDKDKDNDSEPPEFARIIINNLPDGVEVQQGTIKLDGKETKVDFLKTNITSLVGEVAPIAQDDTFLNRCLMGGKCPTIDQYEFLKRFDSAYKETQDAFLENIDPQASMLKADIIIHGPEGSGRTEALLAAAMDAAIVRGQHVLYFVSENIYAKQLANKINSRLEGLHVNCYYSATVLDQLTVNSWLSDDTAPVVPNIIFATPEAVEKTLFGNDNIIVAAKRDQIRQILLSFNVILVDDFLDMPLTDRAHLTFILDKMRLLMASEFSLCQFVIASTPLHDMGVDKMAERLFGLSEFNRVKNVFRLRPRECEPFWYCKLKVLRNYSLDEKSRELAKIAMKANCNTLLYNKGISASEALEMEKDLQKDMISGNLSKNTNAEKIEKISTQKAEGNRCGRVMVKHRLYEIEGIDLPLDTIFYLSLTCGNATVALRLSMKEGDVAMPVFFRISDEDEKESEVQESLALLPDETALALRAWHLRSILPFMPPLSPVEANVWSHFGINMSHPCLREREPGTQLSSKVAIQWHYDSATAYCDQSNGIQCRYSDEVIWPYLVLDEVSTIGGQGRGVNFNLLPDTRECIWLKRCPDSPKGDELTLAALVDDGEKPAKYTAVWKNSRGKHLGETDLSHANELVFSDLENEYVANDLSKPDKSEESLHAMTVTAKYRSGSEQDYTIPVRELKWNIPDFGLRILSMQERDGIAAFILERQNRQGFRITGSISGMANALGKASQFKPMGYDYNAYASCLVLLPSLEYDDDVNEDEENGRTEQQIRACLNGKWSTDVKFGFSPALTHALTGALRKRINGWNFFTVAPAFYIKGRQDSIGEIVVWLVEPFSSGRTSFDVMRDLLNKDIDFRNELLKDAIGELNQLDLTGLRRASGTAFSNEIFTDDDKKQALGALQRLLDFNPENAAAIWQKTNSKKKPSPRRDSSTYSPEEKDFEKIVLEAMENFEEDIDITEFIKEKKEWTPEKVSDVLNDVLWNNPQIFYVSKYGIRYQWWENSDGEYTRFLIRDITYGIRRDELDVCQAQLDEAVEKALKEIKDGDSDVDKALKLHDYIVKTCDYDKEAADSDDASPLARTAYSVLVRHHAVCEGYTMAYRYLLEKVKIQSEEIVSKKMCHCWNYVKINDSWFHVDVTWDDPIFITRRYQHTQEISHMFFMMSDEKARRNKHTDWERRGLPAALNRDFDNRSW